MPESVNVLVEGWPSSSVKDVRYSGNVDRYTQYIYSPIKGFRPKNRVIDLTTDLRALHPQRQPREDSRMYTMCISPKIKHPSRWIEECYSTKDWPMIDLVRHLSNVSASFSQELAKVFWERTHISCENDVSPLRDFLEERPFIHSGIRSLRITLNLCSVSKTVINYAAHIGFLKDSLNLDMLFIGLSVSEVYLREFASGIGPLMGLSAFRKLKVDRQFNLEKVALYTIDFWYSADDKKATRRRQYTTKLWNDHHQNLLNHMMPDTLRPKALVTNEDKYLASRIDNHVI